MFRNLCVVITLTLLAVSCTVGPDYTRPPTQASVSPEYLSSEVPSAPESSAAANADQDGLVQWWRNYSDQLLDSWVEQLVAGNLDLKATAERLVQARELVNIQQAVWWPTFGITSDGTRSFSPGLIDDSARSYRSNVDVSGVASWQIDLFGRTRRAVESAEYSALANANDLRSLELSLIAELVRQRVVLALVSREIEIQEDIVQSRKQTLNTVSRRYELGVKSTSAVSVHVARENSTTAQAQLALLQQQYKESLLSIEVLLNQRPGSLQAVDVGFPLLPRNQVPNIGTPAMLLDRRPDIVGSELRLMAANAGIGVAVADLFPDLTLSGSRGFSSDQLGGLLTNNNGIGLIAANINSRLFEGGRLRAQVRVRESQARELSWRYAQTVLRAMGEVERALVQEQYLRRQVDNLQTSAESARQAESLSQKRYQRGITTLLEVLETQRRRQNAERSLLAAQRASWIARINLHLALGGDWLDDSHRKGDGKG